MPNRILFVLKRKEDYNEQYDSHVGLSTGMYNSVSFANHLLNDKLGIESKMVVVTDNNDIDREVTLYKPTHVIIEALWVVPSKFAVLIPLHPTVQWIVRLHSETPFIANEGIAMDWIFDYISFKEVSVACNSPRLLNDIRKLVEAWRLSWSKQEVEDKVIYLPNYYPPEYKTKMYAPAPDNTIHIGCFGAIRPLKNQLIQAQAAIRFAESINKRLVFHVNGSRVEMKGDPVLHNLRGLFQHMAPFHELVMHPWTPRDSFLLTCGNMDIGMQVSFSETFNIVGADLISQGVPIVTSSEIPWSPFPWKCNPNSSDDIYYHLRLTHAFPRINVKMHQYNLKRYCHHTYKEWYNYFG